MSKPPRHDHRSPSFTKRLLLLGALAGVLLPGIGHSQTFNVTWGDDEQDKTPGNGSCASAAGKCTLRAAIQEANALPGDDTIIVKSDVTLNQSGIFEDAGRDGDLDITQNLTIQGETAEGAPARTVDANGNDRVFHIRNGATVTLKNLKITGGYLNITTDTVVPKGAIPGGGGILVEGASTLKLESVNLTGNELVGSTSFILTGGGLYVDEFAKAYIKDSQISSNRGPGGGGLTNLGHTEIRNTTLTDNGAGSSNGGGIRNMGGYLYVGNATITANVAQLGAGISSSDQALNLGNVIISNTVIDSNRATFFGGGIHNESPVTLTNSTISNNTSANDGGGIYNSALGNMDIINSTISGNSGRSGGGIYNTRGISLTNVTIYNNSSTPCALADCGENGSVGGNQIAIPKTDPASSPSLTVVNTIIANGDSSSNGTTACAGLDGYKSLIKSSGGNLENGNSCGLIPTRSTAPDIVNSANLGLDPNLGVDLLYPGTTPVHKLLSRNSDAADHANRSLCPQVDQRFLSRDDGRCDIGAYEYGASVSQQNNTVDLKLTISDNRDPVRPNDPLSPLTYTVVLTNLYVNASANGVILEIKLPVQFTFTTIDSTSTTEQPDCDTSRANSEHIIECLMGTLPGLGRVEVFVTGHPTAEGKLITEVGVTSGTQEAFPNNNKASEETVVDANNSPTDNFGGNNVTGGGGGGGALHPGWLLTLGGLLLARRQRRR